MSFDWTKENVATFWTEKFTDVDIIQKMIYFIYIDSVRDYICGLDDVLFELLPKHGVKLVGEKEFVKNITLNADDLVIINIILKNELAIQKIRASKARRVLRCVDTCKSDYVQFRTTKEFCDKIDCREIMLAYPTKRYIDLLVSSGYSTYSFPYAVREIRAPKTKKYDIIVAGALGARSYPVRSRLAELLLQLQQKYKIKFLNHPSYSKSTAQHQYVGEKFYDLLDECTLGVTCRRGELDWMVAKYIEYGASRCLPMGDVPSQMCDEMKTSMVSFQDANISIDELDEKISNALVDYDSRIKTYIDGIQKHNMADDVILRLLETLK